jgi:hypothetical protein
VNRVSNLTFFNEALQINQRLPTSLFCLGLWR